MAGPTKRGRDDAAHRIADECIAVRVRMINRVVTGAFDEALRPFGITVAQINVLVSVQSLGEPLQSEIGSILYLEKSTLSRNVERLVRDGYLRARDVADSRSRRLSVSARGRQLIERALPAWESAQERVREILGDDTERALRDTADSLWRAAGLVDD